MRTNFGLGPPVVLQDRGDYGKLMSDDKVYYDKSNWDNQHGRNFLTATDRWHSKDEDWYGEGNTPTQRWLRSEEFKDTDFGRAYRGDTADRMRDNFIPSNEQSVFRPPASSPVAPMPDEFGGLLAPQGTGPLNRFDGYSSTWSPQSPVPSTLGVGGYPDPNLDSLLQGEGGPPQPPLDTAAEAGSEWGGPETFVANMALDMIPTQDRKKINLPWGDKGSASGTLKGAGKGALVGMTLGGPVGAGIGAGVGTLAAGQGYFDSTSAPTMSVSRIKRGQGRMPVGGLLGMGGGMYA